MDLDPAFVMVPCTTKLRGTYKIHIQDPHDPYQLMVESFADSVLHDRPVAIPLAESIANMRVLDRIQQAARA